MVRGMHQTRVIKWSMRIGIAMSVSVCWSLSHAADGRSAIEPATSPTMTSSVTAPTESAAPIPPAVTSGENGLVLRTIPTLSKPISLGGTTLLPYIGAGFGGGYATELDRSLNAQPSLGSLNAGPKNLFGPQLIPNEVQLGIRFPF